ncbi:MAG: transposase [Moorea sp. SIO4A3]|nr:transposase [Moorena sp. SIO4A3]
MVFIDEMGVQLGLKRAYGRSFKGERVYDFQPFYRGQKVTGMGAISQTKVLAIKTINRGMKGEDFQEFLRLELAPKLGKGAVVVMDNLAAHKVEGAMQQGNRGFPP